MNTNLFASAISIPLIGIADQTNTYMKITTKHRSYCSSPHFYEKYEAAAASGERKKICCRNNMRNAQWIERERENFIGILLFELCIYGITFWFIWNVYRSVFAHSTLISFVRSFVIFISACAAYLYLLHPQMYNRERGSWCVNAIKMAKKKALYRHDLLFLD